jgi:uncharacterized protein
MRRIATAALFMLLAAAGSPVRADDANRLKLAKDILNLTHLDDKIRGVLPSLAPSVRQALSREMVDPAASEKAVRVVQAPSPGDLASLMDDVAALYARELTEQDLSDILAFYHTASGQDMLAKEPEIGGAIGMLALQWAITLANRSVSGVDGTTAASTPGNWREAYIATPSRAAVLQQYIDPMDKPEWTALRTVTLAQLVAGGCRGVQLNQSTLKDFWHSSGLDIVTIGDLEMMNAVVAPAFNYFDSDRMKLVCAASDSLFGPKGRLVPDLLSSGDGVPKGSGSGYVRVPAVTGFAHGKG